MRSAASGTNGGQGKKLQRKQKRKRLDKAILACYAHLYEKPHIYCKRYEEKSKLNALFTENSRTLRGMKAKRLKMVSERHG